MYNKPYFAYANYQTDSDGFGMIWFGNLDQGRQMAELDIPEDTFQDALPENICDVDVNLWPNDGERVDKHFILLKFYQTAAFLNQKVIFF